LAQNCQKSEICSLNGQLVTLGKANEVKNFAITSGNSNTLISINDENNNNSFIEFDIDLKLTSSDKLDLRINQDVFFLSANRIGTMDIYDSVIQEDYFGLRGENCIAFLNKHWEDQLDDKYIYDKDRKISHLLLDQVNYWLKHITGSEINIREIDKTNKVVASYKNTQDNFVRTCNTGSGLSYIISILIICLGISLINKEDMIPTIIIENPEIHLHPHAQSELNKFLVFISNHFQIILETHSYHIFNSYRVALKNNNLTPENSSVTFFKYNSSKKESEDKRIHFSKSGKIRTYEKDLFDQFEIDLDKLLVIDGIHN